MKCDYKYFQSGDKVISIKKRFRFRIRDILGNRPELFKVYTFRGYVTDSKQKPDWVLLMVKEDGIFYDGREFISVLEYRRLQLNKLKRKIFFKKLFIKL